VCVCVCVCVCVVLCVCGCVCRCGVALCMRVCVYTSTCKFARFVCSVCVCGWVHVHCLLVCFSSTRMDKLKISVSLLNFNMDKIKIPLLIFHVFYVSHMFLVLKKHIRTSSRSPSPLYPLLSTLSAYREQRWRVRSVHKRQIQTNIRLIGVHRLPLRHLRDSGIRRREF